MMVLKRITLISQTAVFDDNIMKWRRWPTSQNMWDDFNVFFHHMYQKQQRTTTMAIKGGYAVELQNLYGVPPPAPPENHNNKIEYMHTIAQGMKDQQHEMDHPTQ